MIVLHEVGFRLPRQTRIMRERIEDGSIEQNILDALGDGLILENYADESRSFQAIAENMASRDLASHNGAI